MSEQQDQTARVAELEAVLRPFALAAARGSQRWEIFQRAGLDVMECRDVYLRSASDMLSVDNFKQAAKVLRVDRT